MVLKQIDWTQEESEIDNSKTLTIFRVQIHAADIFNTVLSLFPCLEFVQTYWALKDTKIGI